MEYPCPVCFKELSPDPTDSNRCFCDDCKRVYNKDDIASYWKQEVSKPASSTLLQEDPVDATALESPIQAAASFERPAQASFASPSEHSDDTIKPIRVTGTNNDGSINNTGFAAKLPQDYVDRQTKKRLSKGRAIASLILGIICLLAFPLMCFNIGTSVAGIFGIALGILAWRSATAGTGSGKGLAIGGIITAGIGIVLSLTITVPFLAYLLATEETDVSGYEQVRFGSSDAVYSDDTNWMASSFDLGDGEIYILGFTDIAEIEGSGWYLDLEAAGYGKTGYSVAPHQIVSTIQLTNTMPEWRGATMYVNVVNDTDEEKDINECPICEIRVDAGSEITKIPFGVIGLAIGNDLDRAVEAFGEPQSIYPPEAANDASEREGYVTYSYYTENYDRKLDVVSYDGKHVTGISLARYAI